jgi:hypothetical protein
VTEVGEHGEREIEARSIDPDVYGLVAARERPARPGDPVLSGQPLAEFIDLPLLRGDEPPEAGYVAATQAPWPGGIAVYGSPETTGYTLKGIAAAPRTVGTTQDDLPEGLRRFDRGARIRVEIEGEELASVTPLQLFAGQNIAAVRNDDGEWEVLQFKTASLVAPGTYEISELLRGQGGTEFAMRPAVAAGARLVPQCGACAPRSDGGEDPPAVPLADRTVDPRHRRRLYAVRRTFRVSGSRCRRACEASGGRRRDQWVRRTRQGGDSWEAPECRSPRTPRAARSISSTAPP